MVLGKYSFINLLKEAKNNQGKIKAFLKGDIYEPNDYDNGVATIIGLSIPLFVSLLILVMIFWIWALVVTIVWWKDIADWAKVLAIIGLIFPSIGPIITLIVVYVSKFGGKKKN